MFAGLPVMPKDMLKSRKGPFLMVGNPLKIPDKRANEVLDYRKQTTNRSERSSNSLQSRSFKTHQGSSLTNPQYWTDIDRQSVRETLPTADAAPKV